MFYIQAVLVMTKMVMSINVMDGDDDKQMSCELMQGSAMFLSAIAIAIMTECNDDTGHAFRCQAQTKCSTQARTTAYAIFLVGCSFSSCI